MEAKKTWWKRLIVWRACEARRYYAQPNLPLDYIHEVTKIADARKNRRFLNDSNSHAELVFWLMIRALRFNDEVLIYSSSLDLPFYSRILSGSCFLDSKPVFKIILDDKVGLEIIKKLPEDAQNRIDCRIATKKDDAHMIVTHHAFRIEAKDYHDELFVVCNFNEPEVAEGLKKRFNRIWENAVPLSLD